jgi:uncharacterized protein YkwD
MQYALCNTFMIRFTIPFLLFIIAAIGLWQNTGAQSNIGNRDTFLPLIRKAAEPIPTPTPRPTATATPQPNTTFEQEVIRLTNVERAAHGCPPLVAEVHLMNAAEGHSTDMAVNDFFSHTGSNGSNPGQRMLAAGYPGFTQWAENIAAGYTTPAIVMNAWMNSAGHRANILNCTLEEIGVGYVYRNPDPGNVTYRHYWTQVFAKPR